MKKLILLCLALIGSVQVFSQITLTSFATGLSSPVDIKNCGDNRLFIVEQRGMIQILDTNGVKNSTPFLDIVSRVLLSSEQGLLGLAFAPDFATSGYFYVNYTSRPNGTTTISRFHVDPSTPDQADASSEDTLLTIYQPYSNHNGGHIAFGPDGYLYIGMGDGGLGGDPGNRAQNPDSLLGKMLRIYVDPSIPHGYLIPSDNHFASDTTQGRPEIWAMGTRNPWRWSFDNATGDLWIGDVGQDSVEEVDYVPAGTTQFLNFGWKCWEGNRQYTTSGSCLPFSSYYAPVWTYRHTAGCSITGGYIYRGAKYQELFGKYFYTDYCISNIHYLEHNGNVFTDTNLGGLGASTVVSFGIDRWGELYCSTGGGGVYKFSSGDCTPVASINNGNDTITDCGTGAVELFNPAGNNIHYTWSFGGNTIATDTNRVLASQPGYYVLTADKNGCTNTDSIYVDFVTPMNISFSGLDTLYCIYNAAANLMPNVLGGVFSGAGVSGATFNPAAAGAGTWTVTYSYTDPTGCTYTHSQDVRVDECLGVPGFNWMNTMSIFPNPNNGKFQLTGWSPASNRITIDILDHLGRIVNSEKYYLTTGEVALPINLSLPVGVYSVRILDGKNVVVRKIVVDSK